MRVVNLDELETGQTLARDVTNLHRQVIAPAGTVMAPRVRQVLKAWGIETVAVDGEPVDPPLASDAQAYCVPGQPSDKCGEFGIHEHPGLMEILNVAARLTGTASGNEAEVTAQGAGDRARPEVSAKVARSSWAPLAAEAVVQGMGPLASLPTIQVQVDCAIKHPTSSCEDIATVLGTDPALSARLLRIANSAFYGFPKQVEGIAEAVSIIGTRQLQELILTTVVLGQFHHVDTRLVDMKRFWRHSLACGLAARAIAGLRRENNTERYFVAGLLHDIGSLVLYQQFPERAQAALEHHLESGLPLDETESAVIGCSHSAVGAALITAWGLPNFFREATAKHHCTGRHSHTTETAIIHIGDVLTMALGLGSNGEIQLPVFNSTAWDLVGLEVAGLGRAASQVLSQLADAERTFLGESEIAA